MGADANFFDLGGDSLLATRLLARLRHSTGAEVPISALFDGPTPAMLAQRLADRPGTAPDRPALGDVDRPESVPLSYAQERMWFLHRLDDAAATYNIPLIVPLGPTVDADALHAALGDLVCRHESLRTVFAERDGAPVSAFCRRRSRAPAAPGGLPADEIAAHVAAASGTAST
ncbi:condensation domain-containing protein [Streptomyces sp. M10(2022)]